MENVEIESAVVVDMDPPTKEKTPAQWHQYWAKEMEASNKRLRKYIKQGNRVVQRYVDERDSGGTEGYGYGGGYRASKLNLFHKNISTMMAMLYGSVPQIDVKREHADPDDDVARVASVLYERILKADVESSGETLSTTLRAALQDRLLPGMGCARVRYDMATMSVTQVSTENFELEKVEVLDYEDAPIDYIHWQDVRWGWGRTYKEIPWWAFRAWLTKEEVTERFGEKVAKNIEYKNQTPEGESENDSGVGPDEKDSVQKAEIWEIWNKSDKKVFWYSGGADLILDLKDDPLGLDGFFPMPRPMIANCTTTLFIPKADFVLSQDLYNEIDELQSRISTITRAIKVVGVYDKGAGDSVGRMLKEGVENDLIPVDNWAMFSEKGGLQGQIQWFPVEVIASTLQVLAQVQEQKIAQLYEITGMSDIMRGGNTDQYTSGGTQQMKAKMGSIGIQALQEEFARFASELEALKAEVISKHFSKETIVTQSNAGFMPQADLDKVAPALDLMQSSDIKWRVDIKPESISMIDYAQIKSERSEFLTSMGSYIQAATGAAKEMPGATPMLLEMMKWAMAGFKGSEYLEGEMDAAIDVMKKEEQKPKQPEPNPEETKKQVEEMKIQAAQQKQQGEIQKIQIKAQSDMQVQQAKIQSEIAKMNADNERDMTMEQMRSQSRLKEIAADLQASIQEIQVNMEADLTIERAQAQYNMAEEDADHENTMEQIAAQNRSKMRESRQGFVQTIVQDSNKDDD
jgi:hypothetical protein